MIHDLQDSILWEMLVDRWEKERTAALTDMDNAKTTTEALRVAQGVRYGLNRAIMSLKDLERICRKSIPKRASGD